MIFKDKDKLKRTAHRIKAFTMHESREENVKTLPIPKERRKCENPPYTPNSEG